MNTFATVARRCFGGCNSRTGLGVCGAGLVEGTSEDYLRVRFPGARDELGRIVRVRLTGRSNGYVLGERAELAHLFNAVLPAVLAKTELWGARPPDLSRFRFTTRAAPFSGPSAPPGFSGQIRFAARSSALTSPRMW